MQAHPEIKAFEMNTQEACADCNLPLGRPDGGLRLRPLVAVWRSLEEPEEAPEELRWTVLRIGFDEDGGLGGPDVLPSLRRQAEAEGGVPRFPPWPASPQDAPDWRKLTRWAARRGVKRGDASDPGKTPHVLETTAPVPGQCLKSTDNGPLYADLSRCLEIWLRWRQRLASRDNGSNPQTMLHIPGQCLRSLDIRQIYG